MPDARLAMQRAFLLRCVRRTWDPAGEWLDPETNQRWAVSRIRLFGCNARRLHEYGASFAATLLMKTILECALW
eukprot:5039233-Prymnesium_polylepis.1